MNKKYYLFLLICLGTLLIGGTSWGQEVAYQESNYNGKMGLLLEPYLKIQQSLADDSLDGVAENAHRVSKLLQEIRFLVGDKLQADAKLKLEQAKRASGGLGSDDILVVRQSFKILNQFFLEYLELVGLPDNFKSKSLYVFYCPTSNAYWLQAGQELKNPFFGSLMSKSGHLEGKLQTKVTAAFNGF